jgi:hypothetical protein
LEAKINADTDPAVLKTDIESITKSYRIYALVIPQGAVLASADRLLMLADSLTALNAKLQTRITAAQTAGKNVSALQTLSADMVAKIADARVQAQAAITLTSSLTPDNGDQAKFEANKKALQDARTKLHAGEKDLKDARKDAGDITKGIKSFHLKASGTASTTATTTRHNEDHHD